MTSQAHHIATVLSQKSITILLYETLIVTWMNIFTIPALILGFTGPDLLICVVLLFSGHPYVLRADPVAGAQPRHVEPSVRLVNQGWGHGPQLHSEV